VAATKRTYRDPCGIARALDVVGERWALLVVRELMLGPKRFTDLRAALPGLSADILTQRLRELDAAGVVGRSTLPPPAASKVYELTGRGRELEPVLLALGRWGSREPLPPAGRALTADAFALALPTLFAGAEGVDATIVLRLGEARFEARVHAGRLEVTRLERTGGAAPDATIEATTGALAQVMWHGRPLEDALAADTVRIGGDRGAAEAFLALFPPPR
jgi:DNA-binding HxlR family transcriptional regulator